MKKIVLVALVMIGMLVPLRANAMVGSCFVTISLSGKQNDDIVNVALAQNNRTESQMGYSNTFAAGGWCVAFVVDSAEKVGIASSIIPRTDYAVSNFYNALISKGATTVSVPKRGDIAICNNWGHVEIVTNVSGSTISVVGGNGGGKVSSSQVYTSTYSNYNDGWFNKFVRPKYTNSDSFISLLDTPASGKTYSGNVSILGYALHKNGIDHVTAWVNGNAMSCLQYSDPNLARVHPGYPTGKEGFTGTIPFNCLKDGTNKIEVYAYEKNNTPHLVASRSFNYSPDKISPKITNVRIRNVTDTSYTVSCDVWDNVKTTKVRFETWTPDNKGFDDKVVKEMTPGAATNNVVSLSYTVNTSEHNNEIGRYATHIYVYDAWGNSDNKLTNAAIGGDYWKPTKTITYNGKSYELYDTAYGNWTTAKSYCDSIGGYLICINSKEEQITINNLLKSGSKSGYWFGVTDQYVEDKWTWITGEVFNFTNWNGGKTDNSEDKDFGIILQSSGRWTSKQENTRDSAGNGIYGFICERKIKAESQNTNSSSQKSKDNSNNKVANGIKNKSNGKIHNNTSPTTITVESISLEGISKKVASGKKIKLVASILPKNATNKNIKWFSSNKKVATVNQKGVVSVKKKTGGKSVIITAMATDGSRKKAVWKIKSMKGVVKSISVKGAKATLQTDKVLKLKTVVKATKGANKKLKWTSSNPAYAMVNAKGVVKALKAGKGKIVKITVIATDGSNKKNTLKLKIK